MNINRFMAQYDNMARQNRFEVNIHGPAKSSTQTIDPPRIRMRGIRCTNIVLPGRSFITTPHTNYQGGPKTNMINSIDYEGGQIVMTFACDNTFEDKAKLELWQQYIFDTDYYYTYHDHFVGEVNIMQLDTEDNIIYECTLHDAFPSALAAQNLDAAASSTVQTFDVTFAYRTWTSAFENVPEGILGGLAKRFKRRFRTKLREKVQDKIFGNRSLKSVRDKIDRELDFEL